MPTRGWCCCRSSTGTRWLKLERSSGPNVPQPTRAQVGYLGEGWVGETSADFVMCNPFGVTWLREVAASLLMHPTSLQRVNGSRSAEFGAACPFSSGLIPFSMACLSATRSHALGADAANLTMQQIPKLCMSTYCNRQEEAAGKTGQQHIRLPPPGLSLLSHGSLCPSMPLEAHKRPETNSSIASNPSGIKILIGISNPKVTK